MTSQPFVYDNAMKKYPTPEYEGRNGDRNECQHFIIIFYRDGDIVLIIMLVEGVKPDIIGVELPKIPTSQIWKSQTWDK